MRPRQRLRHNPPVHFGKLIRTGLVTTVVAAAISIGASAGVVHAAATYTIDSAAGCTAFLTGIGATGSVSGNECTIDSDGGVLATLESMQINAGWTLTGAFTNNGNVFVYGTLHVTRPMTSTNISVYSGATLTIDASFNNTAGIYESGASIFINAPFNEAGASAFIAGTVAIAADVTLSATGFWNIATNGVTIHSGTLTNNGIIAGLGYSIRAVDESKCGTFVNNGIFANGTFVDECTPKVDVEKGPAQNDPTPNGPITFVVTWGEDVTGFDIDDLELTTTGAVTANFDSITGGPRQYTVTVLTNGEGDVSLAVKQGAVVDAANNTSAASTSIDNTVTLAADLPPGDPEDLVPTGGGNNVTLPALLVLLAGITLVGLGRRRSEIR